MESADKGSAGKEIAGKEITRKEITSKEMAGKESASKEVAGLLYGWSSNESARELDRVRNSRDTKDIVCMTWDCKMCVCYLWDQNHNSFIHFI